MSNQQQIHGHGPQDEGEGGQEPQAAGQAQLNTTGTDDLLDEIDALLDSNAEEFVRSFVQKGGQ